MIHILKACTKTFIRLVLYAWKLTQIDQYWSSYKKIILYVKSNNKGYNIFILIFFGNNQWPHNKHKKTPNIIFFVDVKWAIPSWWAYHISIFSIINNFYVVKSYEF